MLDSILADKGLVTDWLKFGTMFVVSRLLAGGDLTDQAWMMASLHVLLGFTAYHLVVEKVVPVTSENPTLNTVMNVSLKVGTMLVVSRLLSGQSMNNNWMMSSAYTILGFCAYNALVKDLVPLDIVENESVRNAVNSALETVVMSVVVRLLEGKSLTDQRWMMSVLYTCAGFAAYDVGVSSLLN